MTTRAWVGVFRYPGKQHFKLGTVGVRYEAPFQEVEAELRKLLAGIVPDGTPQPDLIDMTPGQLVLIVE
jgi:hypothetical protein